MVTSMTSSGKSSISPLSEGEAKVCDYFDDEIDDQPDLTLYENDSIKGLTPASEFPPSNFASALKAQGVKKGGGESDARDLASELFLANEKQALKVKDSSLQSSLESLEEDPDVSRGKGNLQLDLVNANVSSMRGEVKKKDHDSLLTSLPPPSIMCSQCGGNNINNKEAPNNIVTIQDVISIKSYLQKLRRILHDHEV